MLWLSCIAAAVQALGHHRPSDVLGSTLLACACYSLVAWLLPTAAAPDITHSPRALPPATLALSAAVALAAGARSDTLVLSLVRRDGGAHTPRTPHAGLTTGCAQLSATSPPLRAPTVRTEHGARGVRRRLRSG